MARMRIFIMLSLAVSAGGALAFGTYNFMQKTAVANVEVPTTPVLIAAADLPLGSSIGADDVKVVGWPSNSVPEGALTKPEETVGRTVLSSIIRHELMLDGKLAPLAAGTGMSPVIPSGMRAMSVRVNEVIGVAGYVLPGTHVDVLATANPTDQRADMTSKLVLSNVKVLAAGTLLEQGNDKAKPMAVSVVTLIVTPEQAERLTLASTEGKIQLALRNPLDMSAPATPGIKPAALMSTAPPIAPSAAAGPRRVKVEAPPPPPPPAPAPTVEVIRGDKRANETIR